MKDRRNDSFNANGEFYARKGFRFAGRSYAPGDSFPWRTLSCSARKVHQLYDNGFLTHTPPPEVETANETDEERKAREAAEAEKRKANEETAKRKQAAASEKEKAKRKAAAQKAAETRKRNQAQKEAEAKAKTAAAKTADPEPPADA